ncbi:hypothetical protein ACO0K3_02720 [Undibacterium sp. Rencai35W]|uniref:hypothetical protein n=1 Tax=Undibacterium sp. Rencai35W TaxID=3413046 RepID=UPI003BF39303
MKQFKLFILLFILSLSVQAGTVHRCINQYSQTSYTDRDCEEMGLKSVDTILSQQEKAKPTSLKRPSIAHPAPPSGPLVWKDVSLKNERAPKDRAEFMDIWSVPVPVGKFYGWFVFGMPIAGCIFLLAYLLMHAYARFFKRTSGTEGAKSPTLNM